MKADTSGQTPNRLLLGVFIMKKILILFLIMIIYTSTYCSTASAKEIHLTAIGDSITYGTGEPSKKGYIGRLRDALEIKKKFPVSVNNFAIPRYTTENLLNQLQDRQIMNSLKKADYIILFIGTNDFRKSAGYQFNQLNLKNMNNGKVKFTANLRKILCIIRNENHTAPILVLGLYQPYVEYQNHQEILTIIEEWNYGIVNILGKIEKTYFVPTIDLFLNKPKKKYFSDSLHPNSTGYQLIANRVFQYLVTLENGS
jgi:lysophospholipase L1-like esterase